MIKNLLIAVIAFGVGALLATVVRTALHRPLAVTTMPTATAHDHAAMAAPIADAPPAVVAPQPVAAPPSPAPAAPTTTSNAPINTICPVCGMPVRAAIPPATWQGVQIGFGCSTCPADFAEKPDFYGAAARTNQKAQ
jgi:hypothetical protein